MVTFRVSREIVAPMEQMPLIVLLVGKIAGTARKMAMVESWLMERHV